MKWLNRNGLLRWLRHDAGFHELPPPSKRPPKTSVSATVFTGEADQWIRYLDTSREDRYRNDPCLHVEVEEDRKRLVFHGESGFSASVATHLNSAFLCLRRIIAEKPFVTDIFDQSVFGNPSNLSAQLELRLADDLPSEASREAALSNSASNATAFVVLRSSVVETVMGDLAEAGKDLTPEEHLGLCWPVVRRVLSQLMFPNYPRDRFVEKISLTVRTSLFAINVLYSGKRGKRVIPSQVGSLYQRYVARRDGIAEDDLFDRHPYFRLLNQLDFMFDEYRFRGNEALARVLVREYLDDRYLRLSLAGIMPEVDEVMAPMPFFWEGSAASTPYPKLNHFGILDQEDLKAWKKVEAPFRELGFTLIRQLGIGQFGRVYEALNHANPHIPRHVAIKVDRIVRGKKKEAILNAETTMRIGEALAGAPHVIRVFDAGRLAGKRYTFHVLQLVDGDTLDNLVGIAGSEHSSILRPSGTRDSGKEVERNYLKAIRESTQEAWRRQRMRRPFADKLELAQELDLLTSMLLWLEEIHQLGYAINDLKNGNVMLSRRGQFKGIDLDSYSPILTQMDRVMDFFFLAVTVLLFLLNASRRQGEPMLSCEGLLHSRDALRSEILQSGAFSDISKISKGRVDNEQLVDFLATLVKRCRDRAYAFEPELFSSDINELISLKRNIFQEELVLD
jgi:hypothetical protein